MLNLVKNASEAMGDEGTIDISVESAMGETLLIVRDNGEGIEPTKLANIFEPFVTTRERGRGLGLSIVQTAAHRAGFRVEIESTVGRGACFTVVIPNPDGA